MRTPAAGPEMAVVEATIRMQWLACHKIPAVVASRDHEPVRVELHLASIIPIRSGGARTLSAVLLLAAFS